MSAPQLVLGVLLRPFSLGIAMRCISRPYTCASCLPTPTLPTLPWAASGVLAPRPGGACCFRFYLTRPPSSHYHCNTRANPIPSQGASRGRCVISFSYCPTREWFCHETQPDVSPHLTPDRQNLPCTRLQQCSCAVPRLVSRLRSRNLERHDVWQHILFV